MSRPAGLALVRVLPLAVFAAGCWEKSGLDSGGALDSGPGAVGGGGGGNNGGGNGGGGGGGGADAGNADGDDGGGGGLASCDLPDLSWCFEYDAEEGEAFCDELSTNIGVATDYNDGGCPAGAIGRCAVSAGGVFSVDSTIYFYSSDIDPEQTCEGAGGQWLG